VGLPRGDPGKEAAWLEAFAPDAVVEDLYLAEVPKGPQAGVRAYLDNKASCGRLVVDRVGDGDRACGLTWHLEEDGVQGLGIRATTFVELDAEGRISYLREICEPLYKPGDQTVELLKAIGGDNKADFGTAGFEPRAPRGASDLCRYLWEEAQGKVPISEQIGFFAEDVTYEDFNYESSMTSRAEVEKFLKKFAQITAVKFVAERFSDGERACCFTWHVEIAGVDGETRGISFYELDDDGLISYVRDIPESVIKPPPLQALAAALRPKLRLFQPHKAAAGSEPCNCADGRVRQWPRGVVAGCDGS